MKPRDRECLCKRYFKTKEECESSIERGGKPFGELTIRAYKCRFCDGWHKTKQVKRV